MQRIALQKGLPQNQSAQAETTQPSQDQIAALVNLYQSGQMTKTEQACRELLKPYPQALVAINVLGAALHGQGKLQEAVQAYDKAIQLNPDYAEAYCNRGNTLKDLGRLDEALQNYDKVIQLKPDFAEAYCNLGAVLKELGRLSDAVKSLERAIQLKPDLNEAYSIRGDVYLFQGLNKKGLRMKRFGEHVISFDASNGINILGRNENESN